jgi:hypothetical protein
VIVRVYSKKPHLTAKIQVGFRRLLQQINEDIENATLQAESEETYPSVDLLEETVSKVAKVPALDYQRNPFVSSPHLNLPSERRRSSLFQQSPTKHLLEINNALTISPAKRQKI